MSKENKRKFFLQDLMINIIGTFVGALLAVVCALFIYHMEGQNRCNAQLELVRKESEYNRKIFEILISNLQSIEKQGQIIHVKPSVRRLLSNATNEAYRSEYISRYVELELNKAISIHCANLNKFNRELDSFYTYIRSRIDNPNVSFSFLNEWRNNLIEEINRNNANSEDLIKRISSYLE